MQGRNEMATKIEVIDPDGKTSIFHQYEGFTFPDFFVQHAFPAKDLALQLQWIKDTDIRQDDVIICAFPKTGTHWTWEILNMIQKGKPEYTKKTKITTMLEFNTQEMTSSLTSPRVFNTHLTHNLLPAGIKEKRCKIIHVLRNPKDVCVSMYFHFKAILPEVPSLDWFTKSFRGEVGVQHFCSYLWYEKHWEQFCIDNPDYPVINVYYEDLKKKPESEIARLAKFLDKDLDKDITAISDKCQFANLKQINDEWKEDLIKRKSKDGKSFVYRKGVIGDWKNYLTVAENEAFDEWIKTEMKQSNIKFQYE